MWVKPKVIKIGSRKSQLAMWQANMAKHLLSQKYGNEKEEQFTFDVQKIAATGDKNLNQPLSQFSDKGVFTKELDKALLDRSIDCAVHCVKDLPTTLEGGLTIGCYLKRGKRNDCLVIDNSRFPHISDVNDIDRYFRIGTSSLRRGAMIKHKFPEISVNDIRGNLNTRLEKLIDSKLYDGIILAQIGVERLEWDEYKYKNSETTHGNKIDITISPIDTDLMAYCVGQGGLAIVCRDNDKRMLSILNPMNDFYCNLTCEMERRLLFWLEGGCKIPIGCESNILVKCDNCALWNIMDNNGVYRNKCQACFRDIKNISNKMFQLRLYATVLAQDGKRKIESNETINYEWNDSVPFESNFQLLLTRARNVGQSVANKLKQQGADEIINTINRPGARQFHPRSDVPDELYQGIFVFLDVSSFKNIKQCCTYFNRITNAEEHARMADFWKNLSCRICDDIRILNYRADDWVLFYRGLKCYVSRYLKHFIFQSKDWKEDTGDDADPVYQQLKQPSGAPVTFGMSGLVVACQYDDVEMFKLFVNYLNGDINYEWNVNKKYLDVFYRPSGVGASDEITVRVLSLIAGGSNKIGNYLFSSTLADNLDVCFRYHSNSSNVSTVDKDDSALLEASRQRCHGIVKLLLNHPGMTAQAVNATHNGRTALHATLIPVRSPLLSQQDRRDVAKVVKLLVNEKRLDVNKKDLDDMTPLIELVHQIRYFRQHGKKVNQQGSTADHQEIFTQLVECQRVNMSLGYDGKTALQWLNEFEMNDLVAIVKKLRPETLLQVKSDVSAPS